MDELDFKLPRTIAIGSSILLMSLEDARTYFPGRTRIQVASIFKALNIPILHDAGTRKLFNLYTLEKVLHHLLKVDGTGFILPRSRIKDDKPGNRWAIWNQPGHVPIPVQLTAEDMRKIAKSERRITKRPKAKKPDKREPATP